MNEERERSAKKCEGFIPEIQKMLRAFQSKSITGSALAAVGLNKNQPNVSHWFVPFDYKDWDWSIEKMKEVVGDKKMRAFLVTHRRDIEGDKNGGSFTWHDASAPKNQHVYFISTYSKEDLPRQAAMFHELMHGLVRQYSTLPMALEREEIATDTFAYLCLKKRGFSDDDIKRNLFERFSETPSHEDQNLPIGMPFNYPSLVFIDDIQKLAGKIGSHASMKECFESSLRFADSCDYVSIETWNQFCRNALVMVREGSSLPSIFKAATRADDIKFQDMGARFFELLDEAKRKDVPEPLCDLFANRETFMTSLRAVRQLHFEDALAKAKHQKSSFPLYEEAARQIGELWQGRAYGFAADGIALAAKNFTAPFDSDSEQRARKKFNAAMDNWYHDDFAPISNLAAAYTKPTYRKDQYYIDFQKANRIERELTQSRMAAPQEFIILDNAMSWLGESKAQLPDPLDFKPSRLIHHAHLDWSHPLAEPGLESAPCAIYQR